MNYSWQPISAEQLSEQRFRARCVSIFCALFCGLIFTFPFFARAEIATLDEFKALGEKFDHLTTGFALTGEHTLLDCGECHIGGVFEALPRVCEACHDNVIATGMPSTHVETTSPCDTCHTTAGFVSAAVMDHSIVTGACESCHDGLSATGKSANHIATTNLCEACHTTNFWQHLKFFDHEQVVGSCVTCHNNITTTGKSATHIPTSNLCDACHLYSMGPTWPTFTVDHAEVLGRCSFCHDGVIAIGKDADHEITNEECNACHTPGGLWTDIQTASVLPTNVLSKPTNALHLKVSDNCESCHKTADSFLSTSVDHGEVISPCMDCHNGSIAQGKGPSHIATVEDCGLCHNPNDKTWAAKTSTSVQ